MPEPTRPHHLPRPRALLASARLLIRRRRVARWTLALGLGLGAALWTSDTAAEAVRRRDAWTTTHEVWVLTRDVDAGAYLHADDVTARLLPAAAVPPAAVRGHDEPIVGRALRVDGHEGEILVADRLTPGGSSATAARLPVGTLGIAVPVEDGPTLEVGDTVDVFDLRTGGVLAGGAPVVATGDRSATVAVGSDRAGRVVAALADGGVVLGLRP